MICIVYISAREVKKRQCIKKPDDALLKECRFWNLEGTGVSWVPEVYDVINHNVWKLTKYL